MVRQVEIQAETYFLPDLLLFRIQNFHDEQKAVLCIPEPCVDYILGLYHNSLFGAQQVSSRTFLTIKQNFFILEVS